MVSMSRFSRSGDIGTGAHKTKPRRSCDRRGSKLGGAAWALALARLVARVGLVDHIDPALRRTMRQSLCRFFADFSELMIFMGRSSNSDLWVGRGT
jgi:hypothetical protein